jgi:murein DD-endopeptidase MepM/ murein hydrolase activator NlpD
MARIPARFRDRPSRLVVVLTLIMLLMPVGSAASAAPPPPVPAARFSWPLAPPHPVLRGFVAPQAPWGPGHRGVDLGGTPGDPVLAVADGTVVFAGHLVDRTLVSVDHPNGLRSTYEPIAPAVSPGQRVHRGDLLGHLQPGHLDCPAAACLHWGIRRGDEYLDPLALVTARRIRLLPWPS